MLLDTFEMHGRLSESSGAAPSSVVSPRAHSRTVQMTRVHGAKERAE